MSNKITIYIENRPYEVDDGQTILQAARKCGFNIPTLCNWKNGKNSLASCRVCLVHVDGARGLVPACAYPITDGMHIVINDPQAVSARRTSVELLLSNHYFDCKSCAKEGNCELLEVAHVVGARPEQYIGEKTPTTKDMIAPGLIRDTSKCILCGRCIEACKEAQGISILGFEKRGFKTIVAPIQNRSFSEVPCLQCGQCTLVCPTGALMEHSNIDELDEAFAQKKLVIVQTAPAVRATIGEEFGEKIGTTCTGKMVAALHRLGFYRVFDVNFGADETIVEEASELVERIKNKVPGPMITSCSPGWVNYVEYFYPELLPHLSSCKSPHTMMGATIKSYYAQKHNLDPKNICVVSVMPCTAKKFEITRDGEEVDGNKDVDIVLTTRELARVIKRSGINWNMLPNEEFDDDLIGDYTGAGVIFGVTGGVMEAAIRSAHYFITGKEMEPVDFLPVRGLNGIKSATANIAGHDYHFAVASGMTNAKVLLEEIKAGKSQYDFIEIMGCPGGCINGGGQPYVNPAFLPNEDLDIQETYRQKRADVLYREDVGRKIRRSHLNPDIIKLYNDFFGKFGSEKAHKYLHTHYNAHREKYPKIDK